MRTLITASMAALALAGCADYPVYERAGYYEPAPYYGSLHVAYAPAPVYVERTTVVQAAPRIIREPVVVHEAPRVVHGYSAPAPRRDNDRDNHAHDNDRGDHASRVADRGNDHDRH